MSHQLSIVLNDDEFAALAAESAQSGATIEAVVHERLAASRVGAATTRSEPEVLGDLYRKGVVASIPSGEPDTSDEETEAERLALLFGGGKSAAEMVIEDRGPY